MRTLTIVGTAAMLSFPQVVIAQTSPTPVVEAAAVAIDPARLAAAAPVIDRVWPLGTYARIMHATMDQVISGSMAGMYDLRPEDLAPGDKVDAAERGKTVRQIMAQEDPAFEERMRITMQVMADGMGEMLTEIEPQVRAGLASSYARRFTVEQLSDLQRFLETPTGQIYGAESMMLMAGPDMMKAMQAFAPRIVKAMPAIMAKVQDATKHLPPPQKKGSAR